MNEDTYRDKLTDLQLEVEELRAKLKEAQTGDTISRQAAIDKINERQRKLIYCFGFDNDMVKIMDIARNIVIAIPSAQPQTCEGCKHFGKWENEVEYGYPSPCTRCKRRVEDHYER